MKYVATLIFVYFGFHVIGQNTDPIQWPEPSLELIESGYYSKEKLLQYYSWLESWKRDSLPALYLLFDERKERRLDVYEYGGGKNYEFNFEITPNLVFYIRDRPSLGKPAEINHVSVDSIKSLTIKDGDCLRQQFDTRQIIGSSKCLFLNKQSSSIYIIMQDPVREGYLIMRSEDCVEEFE